MNMTPSKAQLEVLDLYEDYFAYLNPERGCYVWAHRRERGGAQVGEDAWKPRAAQQRAIQACLDAGWIEVGYLRKVTPAGRAILARHQQQQQQESSNDAH